MTWSGKLRGVGVELAETLARIDDEQGLSPSGWKMTIGAEVKSVKTIIA